MQRKHLKLLKLISDGGERMTAGALAIGMGVSDRSIKNYISEINYFEPGLIQSSRCGYAVDKARVIIVLAADSGNLPNSAEERAKFILTCLLNARGTEKVLELDAVGAALCVSYETIKKDLLLVRKRLKEFDLYLNVANDRLVLEGQEKDKRNMFSTMLYTEFSENILSLSEIGKVFPDYDVELLVSILVEACKSFHYFINEYALLSLVLDVVISIDRIKNNASFTQSPGDMRKYGEREITLAKRVIGDIERHFAVVYNPLEMEGLTVVLLSSLIKIDMDEINVDNIESIAGKECMQLVRSLCQEMRRYDFIDENNDEFLVRFSIHIKNLLIRLRHGYVTRNPLTEHIKTTCPLIFECTVAISEKIKQASGFLVDEHEIAYIALHIGSILGTQIGAQNKVSCVLLVPQYHNHATRLISQITTLFGASLIIKAIVTSYAEVDSINASDFLISTIQIPQTMTDWLYINPFLTDRDISALQYKLERISQKKKKARLRENLLKISDEKLFFRNQPLANQDQAIHFMSEAMRAQGYVNADFVQQVFQREHSYSTTFGNIAVPHSMKMDAMKTGLCVVINEKAFSWGGNKVNVVLLFSINQAERALFYDIYDNLIVLLLEPPNLAEVMGCRTYQQFVTTVIECL